jgi:hypothetical protein
MKIYTSMLYHFVLFRGYRPGRFFFFLFMKRESAFPRLGVFLLRRDEGGGRLEMNHIHISNNLNVKRSPTTSASWDQ